MYLNDTVETVDVQLGSGMLVEIGFTPRQNCIRWLGQMSIWTTSGVCIQLTNICYLSWPAVYCPMAISVQDICKTWTPLLGL